MMALLLLEKVQQGGIDLSFGWLRGGCGGLPRLSFNCTDRPRLDALRVCEARLMRDRILNLSPSSPSRSA